MAQKANGIHRDNEVTHDAEQGISADLQSLINACNDAEEFRNLLQNHGIWLNQTAAESAFNALHTDEGRALDDEALGVVLGGMTVSADGAAFLKELFHYL